MFCVFCGKTIDDDSRFCVFCGGRFDNVVDVKGPGSQINNGASRNNQNTQQNQSVTTFQAAICPCCGAPIRANINQCEYCDTPLIRHEPQRQVQPTVQVVAQPVQIVAQPTQYNYDYNNQINQQIMAQNYQAQKAAQAQITAAAIKGGAEITSAALKGGAKIAASMLFRRR